MNKSVFLNLVLQQQPISEPETEALEALAESFPYCQTAHLLLAKAAYDRGSMLSNQKLRRAAAYATNRQLLKKLIYTTTATVKLHPLQAVPEPEIPNLPEAAITSTSAIHITPDQAEPETIIPENTDQHLEEAALALKALEFTEPTENQPETMPDNIPLTAAEASAGTNFAENQPETMPDDIPLTVAEASAGTNFAENQPETMPDDIPLTAAEASAGTEPEISADLSGTAGRPVLPDATPNPESVDEELARLLVIDHILNDPDLFTSDLSRPGTAAEDQPAAAFAETAAEPAPEEETSPETLTDFDQYLFKPEREITASEPEENLQVSFPDDGSEEIFHQDPLGYWMNSSRLGECLQLKADWTTHPQPYDFHPELLLEYNKEHLVTKTLEPADSILSQQLDIIDQFLKQNPRLKGMANTKNIKPEPLEDLALKSTKIKKDMASENLAHIFLQQGKIKKAIKIYEHLMLKIPEKKAYFVAQIEKLQNSL